MTNSIGNLANILLVEDSPADRRLMEEVFREAKVVNSIRHEEDGEGALRALRANGRTDLVLLDLELPGMDGREVLEEMRGDPALRQIPVVVLTGNVSEADIGRSFDLEASGYLTKPITVKKLLRVLEDVRSLSMAFVVRPEDE